MQKGESERKKSRDRARLKDALGLRHHLLRIHLDWDVEVNTDQQFLKKHVLKLFSLGNGVLWGPLALVSQSL